MAQTEQNEQPRPAGISPRPPAWRLILAIVLPLIAVVVVVVLANRVQSSAANNPADPLGVPVVFQPGSTTPGCAALDAALPADLDGHARRTMVVDEPGVAAWGDPPAVLRCGVSDPEELTCSSELTIYNGVSWLPLIGTGSTTYLAVDRSARIALTLDDSMGVGAVQALSNVIKTVMPERAVCTNGVVNPADAP